MWTKLHNQRTDKPRIQRIGFDPLRTDTLGANVISTLLQPFEVARPHSASPRDSALSIGATCYGKSRGRAMARSGASTRNASSTISAVFRIPRDDGRGRDVPYPSTPPFTTSRRKRAATIVAVDGYGIKTVLRLRLRCMSAVTRSFGCSLASCRTRARPLDTLSRR